MSNEPNKSGTKPAIQHSKSILDDRRIRLLLAVVGAIVAWMILIQLPLGLAAALTDWRPVDISALPWILLAGIGALAAHFCLAQALRRLDASIVMPVDFLRVPLAAVVGYYLYAEAIDVWVFLGGAIILGSNLQALRVERRNEGQRGAG